MADGIQVPTAKELGINQHFHKAGEAARVATTKAEADALISDGWSNVPQAWKVYGPRGVAVDVYSIEQQDAALAQGYALEPPAPPVQVVMQAPAAPKGRRGASDGE